jgi:hypothetical protein
MAQINQLGLTEFIEHENEDLTYNPKYTHTQKTLFNHLVMCCKGEALRKLRLVGAGTPHCATRGWKALINRYTPATESRVSMLTEKLLFKTFKPDDTTDIDKYLDEILEIKLELEEVGEPVPDRAIMATIARSLPQKYENTMDNIKNSKEKISLNDMITRIKLKAEELKQKKGDTQTLSLTQVAP